MKTFEHAKCDWYTEKHGEYGMDEWDDVTTDDLLKELHRCDLDYVYITDEDGTEYILRADGDFAEF